MFPQKQKQEDYTVTVNGVKVGQITPVEYETIRKSVYKSPRIWGRWLMNHTSTVFNRSSRLFWEIPLYAVWLIGFMAVFMPAALNESLAQIIKDPSRGASSFATLMAIASLLSVSGMFINLMWHSTENNSVFLAEVTERVRKFVGCPAQGEIRVYMVCSTPFPPHISSLTNSSELS